MKSILITLSELDIMEDYISELDIMEEEEDEE